jgi:hypothetical protein
VKETSIDYSHSRITASKPTAIFNLPALPEWCRRDEPTWAESLSIDPTLGQPHMGFEFDSNPSEDCLPAAAPVPGHSQTWHSRKLSNLYRLISSQNTADEQLQSPSRSKVSEGTFDPHSRTGGHPGPESRTFKKSQGDCLGFL